MAAMGQTRPFAFVEPAPASHSPADLRHDNQVVALGPTDGASYDIPNFPMLELALARPSSKARTSISTSAANTDRPGKRDSRKCGFRRPPHLPKFSLEKNRIGCGAIRTAGSKRRSRLEGWSRTHADQRTALA